MAKVMTSGGEALIKALADENVDIIFGYPGGAALHFMMPSTNKIEYNIS